MPEPKTPPVPTDKVVQEYNRLLDVVTADQAAGRNSDESEADLKQFMLDNPGLGEGGFLPETSAGDPE